MYIFLRDYYKNGSKDKKLFIVIHFNGTILLRNLLEMDDAIFKELMRYDPYETERMNGLVRI